MNIISNKYTALVVRKDNVLITHRKEKLFRQKFYCCYVLSMNVFPNLSFIGNALKYLRNIYYRTYIKFFAYKNIYIHRFIEHSTRYNLRHKNWYGQNLDYLQYIELWNLGFKIHSIRLMSHANNHKEKDYEVFYNI